MMKAKRMGMFGMIFLAVIIYCRTSTESIIPNSRQQFPEVFLESGSDSDYSYISLRTLRLNDGRLEAQATGWGVWEFGLFLDSQISNRTLSLRIMGICGTVPTHTWTKVTFSQFVTRAMEDTLNRIEFSNFNNTLFVIRQDYQ